MLAATSNEKVTAPGGTPRDSRLGVHAQLPSRAAALAVQTVFRPPDQAAVKTTFDTVAPGPAIAGAAESVAVVVLSVAPAAGLSHVPLMAREAPGVGLAAADGPVDPAADGAGLSWRATRDGLALGASEETP